MQAFFADWDPLLQSALAQVTTVQKWKLSHLDPLDTWVRGAVALMGDACHPTLPYQAQGAAMAVEDGETIACLLGLLKHSAEKVVEAETIKQTLCIYERLRKRRTETNVRGAEMARVFLHLPAGPQLEQRDELMRKWDWNDLTATSEWPYFDPGYMKELMGFDAEAEAIAAFNDIHREP
jgi:salicylate hydroxylase